MAAVVVATVAAFLETADAAVAGVATAGAVSREEGMAEARATVDRVVASAARAAWAAAAATAVEMEERAGAVATVATRAGARERGATQAREADWEETLAVAHEEVGEAVAAATEVDYYLIIIIYIRRMYVVLFIKKIL